jgi:predicted transcriptional regulator
MAMMTSLSQRIWLRRIFLGRSHYEISSLLPEPLVLTILVYSSTPMQAAVLVAEAEG